MVFFPFLAILALAWVTTATPVVRTVFGPTSYEPATDLPVDWHLLSQAAGMAQQTICDQNTIGMEIGDAKLLWSQWLGIVNQRVNVFHSKSLGVSVAFESTTGSLFSILHDADFFLTKPVGPLAPALNDHAWIDQGFQGAYLDIAEPTFAQVKKAMKDYNETRVSIVGHSLGAAMALLAAMDYDHRLKHGVHHCFAFGLPRTGNAAFAKQVDDQLLGKFYYVVNGKDWVPHMPSREWGYQHPSGQIWINPPNTAHWAFYPGQENHYGANSVEPIWTFEDHHGVYFHTGLGHGPGKCPAEVNAA
ncbi:Lipase [Malassezia pachydermatis]